MELLRQRIKEATNRYSGVAGPGRGGASMGVQPRVLEPGGGR